MGKSETVLGRTGTRTLGACLVLLGACTGPSDVTEAALTAVVADLRERAPAGAELFLGEAWAASNEPIDVVLVEALKAATGLPSVSLDDLAAIDSTAVVLYLLDYDVDDPRSVAVGGGWMRLFGGEGGGAWGHDIEYVLDCATRCAISKVTNAGVWN